MYLQTSTGPILLSPECPNFKLITYLMRIFRIVKTCAELLFCAAESGGTKRRDTFLCPPTARLPTTGPAMTCL